MGDLHVSPSAVTSRLLISAARASRCPSLVELAQRNRRRTNAASCSPASARRRRIARLRRAPVAQAAHMSPSAKRPTAPRLRRVPRYAASAAPGIALAPMLEQGGGQHRQGARLVEQVGISSSVSDGSTAQADPSGRVFDDGTARRAVIGPTSTWLRPTASPSR